jgi:prepilin-type processing-associated H-X9-DG protein
MLYQTKASLTTPAVAATVLQFVSLCSGLPGSTLPTDGERGVQWQATYPGYTNWDVYNHVGAPNSTQCGNLANNPTIGNDVYGSSPPTSFHNGGVNVAFCDGSVHFVKDTVGLQAWWALGTIAGGEVLSADQY